tara:strand:+ start:3312 stop:3506 length:195 start_codon:yes stop_codon:yes gene_type:complete
MSLENTEVITNLTEQKKQLEEQMEQLRVTYFKVVGALDALNQIEESKVEDDATTVSETEIVEGE